MMQTTPLTEEQKQLVLECSERIRKLAWKYSRDPLDFEDMYALGMAEVCQVVARAATLEEPIGYLYRSAQNAMIDELKRKERNAAVSLDAPLSSRSAFCLADTLASPSSFPVPDAPPTRTSVVHAALARLATREREVIRQRYGFDENSCGILSNVYAEIGHALSITRSGASSIATVAHRKLRADAELCQAVGTEPPSKEVLSDERRAALQIIYARELSAFHAGYQSISRLAKAMSLPRSTAAKRLVQMREAGLIPMREQARKEKGQFA